MKSVLAAAALAAAVLTPAASQAAAPGYCHHYADLAVAQFRWNREIPGCFHGADRRWNADWDAHYSWCLGADYGDARNEDSYRGGRIHECRMRAFCHP